jgi:lysosomal alpha-mannosidase
MYRQSWSALSDLMPMNVHLLTFDQLDLKQYLVRVEHYFELNEDEIYSQPVTIDLQTLFKSIGTIAEMIELTLSANLPLSELHRLDWMTQDRKSSHVDMSSKLNFIEIFPISQFILRTIFVERNNDHPQSYANSNI